MKFETVTEFIGENGIPSRVGTVRGDGLPLQEIRALRERGGCCAWRGRTACNDEPVYVVIGGWNLMFSTYRACSMPNAPCYALACERHFPDIKRDMPVALRKSQRRELLKVLESRGVEEDPVFMAVRLDEVA